MESRKAFVVLGHGYPLLEEVEVPPNEVVIYSAKAGTITEEEDIQNVIDMFISREFPPSIMQPQITADTDVSDVKEFLNNGRTSTRLYTRKPSQHIHNQVITFEATFVVDNDRERSITFKKAGIYSDLSKFDMDSSDIEDALTVCEIPIVDTADTVLVSLENIQQIYDSSLYPNYKHFIGMCKQLRITPIRNADSEPCVYYSDYMRIIEKFDLDLIKLFDKCKNSTIALMVCRNTDDADKIARSYVKEGFGRRSKTKRRKTKRRKTKRRKTKRRRF